jgi:hypothetical protein
VLALILVSVSYSHAEEILYPANNDIQVGYLLSSTNLNVGDTLIITRTLVNNSPDMLHNLYWVENLPIQFEILMYGIYINGTGVDSYYSGALENSLCDSCEAIRWAVDIPSEDDPYDYTINPSDSIALVYSVICQTEGSYTLPFHTACFHDGDHGSYTIGEPVTIDISYQSGNGNIAGTVTDHGQNPIQNAAITVIETGALCYSTGAGLYLFSNLQPGVYSLRVSHPEYNDAIETDIHVYAGQTTIRDIILYSPDLLYVPGDVNGDGAVTGNDVTYAVNYFRDAGPPPPYSVWLESSQIWLYAAADANGDCKFIGSDVTYLVNFFRGANDGILYCPEAPPQ